MENRGEGLGDARITTELVLKRWKTIKFQEWKKHLQFYLIDISVK